MITAFSIIHMAYPKLQESNASDKSLLRISYKMNQMHDEVGDKVAMLEANIPTILTSPKDASLETLETVATMESNSPLTNIKEFMSEVEQSQSANFAKLVGK